MLPQNRLPPPGKLARRNTQLSVNSLIRSAATRKRRQLLIPISTLLLTSLLAITSASFLFQPDLPYIDVEASSITTTSSIPSTASQSSDFLQLFSGMRSAGTLALCAAEGNCILSFNEATGKLRVKFSSEYYGHSDPGNNKFNRGFCSDQGRGGVKKTLQETIDSADRGCLNRTRSRIDRAIAKMKEAGLDPAQHQIVFIHFLDLWNQASPRVSDNFPKVYAKAIAMGKTGDEAINWARVEAFRKNGELEAGQLYPTRVGLFKVCVEQPYFRAKVSKYEKMSNEWRQTCILTDQARRTKEISNALNVIEQVKKAGKK